MVVKKSVKGGVKKAVKTKSESIKGGEEKMGRDIKVIFDAKRRIADGSLVIWNERLKAVAASGSLVDYLGAIDRPIDAVADNVCNNCNCTKDLPIDAQLDQVAKLR
ncbi:MAG: hypothetical protein IME99_01035 [Proteobacteria bacterium]|nr:hypothetical protein [Pseudomonadota bacterium]